MPGKNLTRTEAESRSAIVCNPHYEVTLDLTKGPKTFLSTSHVTFEAQEGASTWIDLIAPKAMRITLNGTDIDPESAFKDCRIALNNLQKQNDLTVVAECEYSHTGEGLHRAVDTADGLVYLYTQFEVMDARRVYAAFDQPDIKGTFNFTVLAPKSWTVTSTMLPTEKNELEGVKTDPATLSNGVIDNVVEWVFPTTPRMSSYLTSLVAGPYAEWHTEYKNADGRILPMGLYCRQSIKDGLDKDADYLFKEVQKGFDFYNKTFGVIYPYQKYDQIFVPEYNAGAMENIGNVTVVDSYVFQSKVSDAVADRRVSSLLHELAHMWFGDLVTMKWWNDLWLNESFAEFMCTLCTAEATEWTTEWSTFASGEKSWGEEQDQLPTTHPVVAPINDINDTEANFDGITYAKGGSVLHQLMAYVGRENFFKGIHNYLVKHSYGNATLNDLLEELNAASGRDLDAWSKLWLQESGINTLTTVVDTDENGIITKFVIKQKGSADNNVLRPHTLKIGFRFVYRAHNFHYQWVTYFVGKVDSLLFLIYHAYLLLSYTGSIKHFVHFIRTYITILTAVYHLAYSFFVYSRQFYIFGLWFRSVNHFRQSISKYTFFGEVDAMFVGDKVSYLVFYVNDRRQYWEDGLFASLHFLVKHFIYVPVGEQSRTTEYYGHSIDVVEIVLASVDDISKLFGSTCSQEVDRVTHRRTCK